MMFYIQRHLYELNENGVFGYLSSKLAEAFQHKVSNTSCSSVHPMHEALHIAASLISRALSRLILAYLEGPSMHWPKRNFPPNVPLAVESLLSVFPRIETILTELQRLFASVWKL